MDPTNANARKTVDFFISYARNDLAWAQWIAQTLEYQGYKTRYQDRDFAIGTNFVAEMDRGVVDAQAVIAVLSPEYVDSSYCREEWTAAVQSRETELVPVRIVDFDVDGLLTTRAYVDLVGLGEVEARSTVTDRLMNFEASGGGTSPADLGRASYGFPARLHHVPAAPAPLLGRDDQLDRLEERLEADDNPVPIIPDTEGRTGRGCTSLAADYVRSRGALYEKVYWIHGTPADLLPLEFWRLGRQLGLPPRLRTLDEVHAALAQRAARGRILVVIDNAPPRGTLMEWLPPEGMAWECIITSASGSYDGETNLISLGRLSHDEARRALVGRVRGQPEASASELLERLDNDPQLVALASAYMRAVPATPAELRELIDARATDDGGRATELALKQVVMDRLEQLEPPALRVVAMLSFGAPRPVPLVAFESATGTPFPLLNEALQSSDTRQAALTVLTRLGLAHVVLDTVAVAVWVGVMARTMLSDRDRALCHLAAVRLFARALRRATEHADHDAADQLAAHLYAAVAATPEDLDTSTALDAHRELGRYLSAAGMHGEALAVIASGLHRIAGDGDVDRSRLVGILRESALAHQAAGDHEAAMRDLSEARAAAEDLDADDAVPVLLQMGRLLAARDRPQGAIEVFAEAEQRIADDGGNTLLTLRLGDDRTEAARLRGDLEEALHLARERIDVARSWQGPDGVHAIAAQIDHGRLLYEADSIAEASDELATAIGYLEQKREDDALADALVLHADALMRCGEHHHAKLLLGRAAVIYAERNGRQSDEVHNIQRRLADIYDVEGDGERARELRRRAGIEQQTPATEGSATLEKLDAFPIDTCTPILGPGITTRLFTSREAIARSWAAEYPMEQHQHRSLPEIAQYRAIRDDDARVRRDLKAHIARDLLARFEPALPYRIRQLPLEASGTLDAVITAVGAVARWCDPFEHHAVLADLPVTIYVSAGVSDLLRDALIDCGKEPRVAICDWRPDAVSKGAPEAAFNYDPTPERPLVLHIFGHLRQQGSVVLTESDHIRFAIELARGTGGGKVLPHVVNRAMAVSPLLILGFELQSWEFHVLFQALIDQPGTIQVPGAESVAVNVTDETGWIDPVRAREYVQGYFKHRRVEVLWDELDSVIRKLSSVQRERGHH